MENPRLSTDDQRYTATRRVTIVGAAVNLVLAVAKAVFGVLGQSQALVADGVHSLTDLLTDGLVLLGAEHGSRAADEEHPYGHRRIETAVTVALGVLLLLVAGGIAFDAARRLFAPELLLHPGPVPLLVAAASVVSKEWLYRYTLHAAKRVRSNLMEANAWHHRSDAVSSVIVIVGIAGTLAGLPYLDALAAVAVALMIAKVGWDLGRHSIRELVDTGLEAHRVEEIRNAIASVHNVRALHLLRTRRMGADALVDVHIQVDPKLSVSEGHQISEAVRAKLIQEIDEVADVMVHIDPEDDEHGAPCDKLPLRQELLERLDGYWARIPEARQIRNITLHYLDGKIVVEVLLPVEVAQAGPHRHKALVQALSQAVNEDQDIGGIQVRYG